MPQSQIIHLHRAAPDKPLEGQPCNGCGVCCASEPCPVGILVSRKLKGACRALFWSADEQRYRCGLIVEPQQHLPFFLRGLYTSPTFPDGSLAVESLDIEPQQHLPRSLRGLSRFVVRLAYRYISAGSGCDSTLQAQREQLHS